MKFHRSVNILYCFIKDHFPPTEVFSFSLNPHPSEKLFQFSFKNFGIGGPQRVFLKKPFFRWVWIFSGNTHLGQFHFVIL